jgi:hypothetical protein
MQSKIYLENGDIITEDNPQLAKVKEIESNNDKWEDIGDGEQSKTAKVLKYTFYVYRFTGEAIAERLEGIEIGYKVNEIDEIISVAIEENNLERFTDDVTVFENGYRTTVYVEDGQIVDSKYNYTLNMLLDSYKGWTLDHQFRLTKIIKRKNAMIVVNKYKYNVAIDRAKQIFGFRGAERNYVQRIYEFKFMIRGDTTWSTIDLENYLVYQREFKNIIYKSIIDKLTPRIMSTRCMKRRYRY